MHLRSFLSLLRDTFGYRRRRRSRRLVVFVGGKRNRKRTIYSNVVFVKVKRMENGGSGGDGKWKRSNEFSFVSHPDDGRIVFSLFVRDARRFCVTYLVKETRETDNPQPTNRDCSERRRSLFSPAVTLSRKKEKRPDGHERRRMERADAFVSVADCRQLALETVE